MQVSWWLCVKCFEAPPTHPTHIRVLLKILHQKCFLRLSDFDLLGPIRKSLFLCNIKTKTSEFRAARFCLWKRVQNIHCFGQCSTKIWHMPFLSNMKSWEENLRFGARLHYNSINSVAKFWLSGLFPCFSSSLENSPLTSPLEDSNLDTPSRFWQQCGTSTFNPTSNFSWSGKRNNNQPNCFKQLQSFGQKKSKLENIRTHQTLLSLDEQRFQVFCQIKKMVFRNVGNLKWQSRGEYINRLCPISETAWDFVLFPVLRVFLQIRCFLLSRCNRKWQLVLFAAIIRPTKVDCQVHKTVNAHFSYIPPPKKKEKR